MARVKCHVRLVVHRAGLILAAVTRLLLPLPLAVHQCDPPLGPTSGRAFRSTGRVRRWVLRIQAARRAFPRATSDEQPRALARSLAPCAPQANPRKAATRQTRKIHVARGDGARGVGACMACGERALAWQREASGATMTLLSRSWLSLSHMPVTCPPGKRIASNLRRSATARESSGRRGGSAHELMS